MSSMWGTIFRNAVDFGYKMPSIRSETPLILVQNAVELLRNAVDCETKCRRFYGETPLILGTKWRQVGRAICRSAVDFGIKCRRFVRIAEDVGKVGRAIFRNAVDFGINAVDSSKLLLIQKRR